jgi:oxygen-independent coproporphyrinogen III oxidase
LSKEVYRAWDWIQAAQFPNVNIDLISGMVGETWDNWKENIRRTIELSPESVTIYQMELPFNTVYSKDLLGNAKESPVADWPTKRSWVEYAFEQLKESGYSISSAYTAIKDVSKVSFSYRDNLWQGSDLLATGIASFGHASGIHYQNTHDMNQYVSDVLEKHQLPISRAYQPTPHQRLIREMILQLKKGRLSRAYFSQKFSVDIIQAWQPIWDEYKQEGWAEWNDDQVELTMAGLLRVDGLLPAFFEPVHQNVRYT